MESQVRGFSHSQRYQIALQFCGNHAGLRFERNFFLGCSDLVRETREATRAVATHLRFSAIGVEVTHTEICAVAWLFEQQDPVGADAAMPITQPRDLAAIQPNVSHPVVDKDEIVSGAIHFREAQHDSDCSDSYAGCHVERSHPPLDHAPVILSGIESLASPRKLSGLRCSLDSARN